MMKRTRPTSGTIGFYVDLTRDRAHRTAQRAAECVRARGFTVALHRDQDDVLGLATSGADPDDAIMLVVVGGDGTLLRAAKLAAPLGIPLFGINTGRLGFLTEVGGDDVAALAQILDDGFIVEERAALAVYVGTEIYFALNDAIVRRRGNAHMTPFGLEVDGEEAARVPADGIAVATPTGSTAYFLSAGGPILAPDVPALGIVALLPHTLFSRPLIVSDNASIVLTCESETGDATVEADGMLVAELRPKERILVRKHAQPVRFARFRPLKFYTLLEEKMRWNAPIKASEPAAGA